MLLIIAASSIANYYHYNFIEPQLSSLSKGEFELSNLIIEPAIQEPRQPIKISVEVTNTIQRNMSYPLDLMINGSLRETQTVQLAGFATTLAEFTVNETTFGEYSVSIGNSSATFSIQKLEMPDTLKLSSLVVSPSEAWVGENVQISVEASNIGDEDISYLLPLRVDNANRGNKAIQLSAGATETVEFNVTESSEGTYSAIVGGLNSKYTIVPTGKHTLRVSTFGEVPFTINGISKITPYRELIDVGTYTIAMPAYYEYVESAAFYRNYQFLKWEDGSTSPTRTITLENLMLIRANFLVTQSCPSLYVWNGTSYIFNGDVSSSGGWLGFVDHYQSDGSIVFAYSNPWDYLKLSSQTQTRNGYFDLALIEEIDEIYYLDSAKLIAVDHPANVDVFSTAKTYIYSLDNLGKIYTVSKNPSIPVSAINGEGQNVLPQISKADGITADGNLWKWDLLQLNLGNLADAEEIKLVVNGTSVWQAGSGSNWNTQYTNQTGVTPQPPPYMEVKDANGNWVRVPDNRQFPILPADPLTIVVNLTGLFPTNDYSLRINTFQDIRFDYFGVDTTQQQNITIREIKPNYADFTQAFNKPSNSSGNFTRYGDVIPLVLDADNKMVIGGIGDQILLRFPDDLGSVPAGMGRDYFFVASLWFKGKWVQNQPFTTDPLPFQEMSSYPYPPTESYPYDAEHLSYLMEYNNRTINSLKLDASFTSFNILNVFGIIFVVCVGLSLFILHRKMSSRRKQAIREVKKGIRMLRSSCLVSPSLRWDKGEAEMTQN